MSLKNQFFLILILHLYVSLRTIQILSKTFFHIFHIFEIYCIWMGQLKWYTLYTFYEQKMIFFICYRLCNHNFYKSNLSIIYLRLTDATSFRQGTKSCNRATRLGAPFLRYRPIDSALSRMRNGGGGRESTGNATRHDVTGSPIIARTCAVLSSWSFLFALSFFLARPSYLAYAHVSRSRCV